MTSPVAVASIRRVNGVASVVDQDLVAVEAPLTITLTQSGTSHQRSLGVTMRTPGHDRELVLGLLHAEGVIRRASDVLSVDLKAIDGASSVAEISLASAIDLAALPTIERA